MKESYQDLSSSPIAELHTYIGTQNRTSLSYHAGTSLRRSSCEYLLRGLDVSLNV